MRYGSIYLIRNLVTEKLYIGQTTNNVSDRFKDHCTEKRNRHISNSIQTYGKHNFEYIELYVSFSLKDLNEKEVFFVKHFNTMYPNGYNHRAGGEQNGICSEELKRKISLAKTGKPNLKRRNEVRTQEQRVLISRGLGGQEIVAVNVKTGETKIYPTAHATRLDGFNPSNVVQICKRKTGRLKSKGFFFYYLSHYANQSGSSENKKTEHAQRIEIETDKSE